MPYKIGLSQKRKKILEEELNRIIPIIIKMDVEKIILFGSYVSENMHKSSDLDIIIIKKEVNDRFLDRLEEFYQNLKPKVGIDIFVYSPQEIEMMEKSSQFICSALRHGRIIYEK